MEHIWTLFIKNVMQTAWQEWASTLLQIASVWYAKKNRIWVYPSGIVGVLLASYIYYFMANPPLYADAILNVYYFFMSIYGWYHWVQKENDAYAHPIKWCNQKERKVGVLLFLISWMFIYVLLISITNSNTPVLDSLVSSSAVTSMWWMATRKIENWIAWIFSNLVAIPLNFYKGFMLFTFMYILFLLLAVLGYMEWVDEYKKQRQKERV